MLCQGGGGGGGGSPPPPPLYGGWETYRTSLNKREALPDFQYKVASTTQEDTVNFEKKVLAFRGTFQRIEPFAFDIGVEETYTKMDTRIGSCRSCSPLPPQPSRS